MDNIYSKKRSAKYKGPTTSDDYNARIEENYRDLLSLTNKANVSRDEIIKSNRYIMKNLESLSSALNYAAVILNYAIATYSPGSLSFVSIYDSSIVDNDRFDGTAFELEENIRCEVSPRYAHVTLPKVLESSSSKLKFEDIDGEITLPSTFEAYAIGDPDSVDDSNAYLNTTDVADAVVGGIGSIWERNVIVNSAVAGVDKAIVDLYFRIPSDVSAIAESNCIVLDPYPMIGTNVVGIAYSTKSDPALNDQDVYVPLNKDSYGEGDTLSNSLVPPGAFTGDKITMARPLKFYFDPVNATSFKITLEQERFIKNGGDYVFTYGLSDLDVRYDKFMDIGKTIIRIDAPGDTTFSEELDITPAIYNVSLAEIPYVFSYRTIWETSYDSGVYTTTPVPFSNRLWVEVTLNKTVGGVSPVLNGLKINT